MKHRRWIGILLALAMTLGLTVPAFAEGEPSELPPPAAAEGMAEISSPGTGESDVPPEDGSISDAAPMEEPEDESVTLDLTGAVDKIEKAVYYAPDGTHYEARQDGVYYLADEDAEPTLSESTSGIRSQMLLLPDCHFSLTLDPAYDIQTENGTVEFNEVDPAYFGEDNLYVVRWCSIIAPAGGTVTVNVVPSGETVPQVIPATYSGWTDDIVKSCSYGSSSVGTATRSDGTRQDTIVTGTDFSVVMAQSYEPQVLEGGSVTGSHAPDSPSEYPGCTEYDVHVDLGASQFVITATAVCGASDPDPAAPAEPEIPAEPEETGDVTVNLAGAVDKIDSITYLSPDSSRCYVVNGEGISYNTPEGVVWLIQSTGIPAQFTAAPGTVLSVYTDMAYAVTADSGTVTDDQFHSFPLGSGELVSFRQTEVQAPASGSMTVTVADAEDTVPARIPFTFYNEDWDNGVIVGGGSSSIDGQFAWSTGDTVITGGSFEVWTGPGYEIQVLEGGSIVREEAPSGAGADYVPAGSTSFVLKVDQDGEKFVIAAVKEGETFTPPEEHTATGTFKDVPDDSWYKDVVEVAYAAGVVTGTSADTFSPNATASRAQTVTMLWRQAGSPQADDSSFTDLSADWYRDAVDWASWVGAVNGTSDASFVPNGIITREQLAAALYRLAGSPTAYSGGLLDNYTDGDTVSSYARTAMQWALDYGIIKGYDDGTVRPSKSATRAEICAMLMRYAELVGRFPTEPAAADPEPAAPQPSAPVQHVGRNLDNPKLIPPKREKIDDGLYDSGDDHDKWMQQWAETFWGLDRSGEDIMWCTRYLTRLRSGPGEEYDVVWTIQDGNEVSRLGPDENGWTPVVYHQYVTSDGFTGWDYTGYLPTQYLTKDEPERPTVQPTNGPDLERWCNSGGGEDVGDYEAYMEEQDRINPFCHTEYEPTSVSGSTYTYTISGGGTITVYNVVPGGIACVSTSERVNDPTLSFRIEVERGYGLVGPSGYISSNLSDKPWGCGITQSTDYSKCWVSFGLELNRGEDADIIMTSGDDAPRVLQVSLKDNIGALRMPEACHQFIMLDKDGNPPNSYMDFFNLKGGYKLRSLSPYVSVGRVEAELHYFTVGTVPAGVDQIWLETTWG